MKLVDLNQTIFIPVVDETHGGVTVEMKMTVGEFFTRCCQGFELEVIEAIPVEWLKSKRKEALHEGMRPDEVDAVEMVLWMWQKEQEAR